ncbi:MAG: Flp pilus assembly protein CpaB [Candidatus Omnitrophica bacterium]|nr:Flp pilus assembly protein CpaB [Candidatus Omnitrophota bacterium]
MNLENKKQIGIIFLAVGLGLVAAFLTSQYVQKNVESQTRKLAAQYQNKNKVLLNEMELMKREMKKMATNQAALARRQQELKDSAGSAPKVASAKEPVAPVQQQFSIKVPPGKRAITLNIDSLSAVGGLIDPGDIVDIIAELNMPDQDNPKVKQKVTSVLFQKVLVLAVGSRFNPAVQAPQKYAQQQKARSLHITLAVTPEEAGLLTFAQRRGKLQLTLRSPIEEETQVIQVASWDALSDFVLENQGTELLVPKRRANIQEVNTKSQDDDVKPFIQIFKSGRETRQ